MKKLIASILIIATVLCLFSCGSSTFDNVVKQLEEQYWQSSSVYTRSQVNEIEESIKSFGIGLSGDVKNVAHFIKPSYPESTWVYVYEFESGDDAELFKSAYADSWGSARILDNVVAYGNNEEIIKSITIQ